jgi:hypothetical protein
VFGSRLSSHVFSTHSLRYAKLQTTINARFASNPDLDLYINYDGGTRQSLLAEEKEKDPEHAEELSSWHFWIFSPQCLLPEGHMEYTQEKCSQEDFWRIVHDFNSRSGVAQGQSKL